MEPEQLSDEPFGTKQRDWKLLWRLIIAVFFAVGGGGVAVALYAGQSAIREQVQQEIRPIAQQTAAEFARYLLKESYTVDQTVMTRRVDSLERIASENRARIDNNQRETIDRLHRLEVMLREGFAKQGVNLAPNSTAAARE